jgi:hypothetical protein
MHSQSKVNGQPLPSGQVPPRRAHKSHVFGENSYVICPRSRHQITLQIQVLEPRFRQFTPVNKSLDGLVGYDVGLISI